MRVVLLAVATFFGIAGFALGSTHIAPWQHLGPSYYCKGYNGAAWCRLRGSPYQAFVTRGQIGLFRGGEPIFGCENPIGDPYEDCTDFR